MEIKAHIDFRKNEVIGGNGWNSEVSRGFDPQLSAELVFKRIEKKSFRQPEDFFQEAQALYASRHNNVLEVNYACQDSDYVWLAMPFCRLGSLQDLLRRRILTPREVINVGLEFLTGLQHVHSKGLLHLDVKPANILFADNRTALVADFGCSRLMDDNFLAEPLQAYPLHQVPERLGPNPVSKVGVEADIYQAGLTLYRMTNGEQMFFAPIGGYKGREQIKDQKVRNKINDKIRKGKYPERNAYWPHVPEKLRRTINRATATNPDERYHSVADLIQDLSEVKNPLDWQLELKDHEKCWTQDSKSVTTRISLSQDGTITTTKMTKPDGSPRRVTECCGTKANETEAMEFVREICNKLSDL